MAEDERFPPACGHDLKPLRFLSTCILFQVFERSHVMYLYLVRHTGCPALFTRLSQEPSFQFRPFPGVLFYFVLDGCGDIPDEGDASPGGYQWLFPFTWDRDLQSFVFSPLDIQFRFVLLVHLAY